MAITWVQDLWLESLSATDYLNNKVLLKCSTCGLLYISTLSIPGQLWLSVFFRSLTRLESNL